MKNEEYERLLSPTPIEFLIWLCEGIGQFLWRVAQFSPTNTIANALGHGFDPNGSRLPEWTRAPETEKGFFEDEEISIGGGFPVAYGENGLEYFQPPTKPEMRAEKEAKKRDEIEITEAEKTALKTYNPQLLNITIARKIKRYWMGGKEGKSDKEAAILADCSLSYARHYRLAFEKANKTT